MTEIRENGATSGAGLLATYAYDDRGRRTLLTRGNGTTTTYSYDDVSRRTGLSHDLAGSGGDVAYTYGFNPAGQIASTVRDNDAFAWTGHYAVNRNYTANGLNQYSAAGSASFTYDANGNLASDGTNSYSYDVDNRLNYLHGQLYDPLGRLFVGGGSAAFLYDGAEVVMEADPVYGLTQRRYVFGPAGDEPLVWYEGSGLATRNWLHADERGSVVAVSNGSGALTTINRYDEYGLPQGPSGAGTLAGRFGYTGQAWIPENGLYHYRARTYSPTMGRFLQTDPIGYDAGMNVYSYVGNDPVNFSDPMGLQQTVTVTGPAREEPGDLSGDPRVRTSGMVAGPTISDNVHPDIVIRGVQILRQVPRPSAWWLGGVPGRVIGLIIDNIVGYPAADADFRRREPPADADDPNGAKAPGRPGEAEGFSPPPPGQDQWGQAPNGRGWGWIDDRGKVWVPTGPGPGRGAHGGPHWDVQSPGGRHENVYPGGGRR